MCIICQGGTARLAFTAVPVSDTSTIASAAVVLKAAIAPQTDSAVAAVPSTPLAAGPDVAGTTATTVTLPVGQVIHGTLETAGDRDWYKIDLVAGQTYTFALVGIGTNNVIDPLLNLRDAAGNIIRTDDDSLPNLNSVITFTALTTGRYFLDAGAYGSGDIGTYGLSITAGTRASFDTAMGAGIIDSDSAWNTTPGTSVTITYAFRDTVGAGGQQNFSRLTAAQITAVEQALAQYSEFANVTFTRVNPTGYSDNATILFGNYRADDGAGAYAYYPGSTAATSVAGDVWLNTQHVSTTSLLMGSYSNFVVLHELGHAMGLSHPGLYNAAPGVSITYANNAQFVQDSNQYSVMSYFDESATGTTYNSYPDTMMLFDVVALQAIYGANQTTRTGDTVYGYNSNAGTLYHFVNNTTPAFVIWDAGGNDTLDGSGFTGAQTINLNAGATSSMRGYLNNITIAPGALIENAFGGSGNDTLIGNDLANHLAGNVGNDTVMAGDGNDTIDDGAGADRLDGGAGIDLVRYLASSPMTIDLVAGTATNGLGEVDVLISIENVTTGNGADNISGSSGANVFDSGLGNDVLNGRAGDDILRAGDGADKLLGGSGNDWLEGGAGRDTLSGGSGNDVFIGGLDKDYLIGGTEADIFRWLAAIESPRGSARDRIIDFTQAEGDRMDVSALDAITGGGDDAFTWVGDGAFTGAAGQLHYRHVIISTVAFTLVEADMNGDKVSDFEVEIMGHLTLQAGDFIL